MFSTRKKHLFLVILTITGLMWMMSLAAFGTPVPIVPTETTVEKAFERGEAEIPTVTATRPGHFEFTTAATWTQPPRIAGLVLTSYTLDDPTTLTTTWADIKALTYEQWKPGTTTGIPLALLTTDTIKAYADASSGGTSVDGEIHGKMALLPADKEKETVQRDDDTRKAGTVFGEKPDDTGGVAGVVTIDTGVFQQDRAAFEEDESVVMGEFLGEDAAIAMKAEGTFNDFADTGATTPPFFVQAMDPSDDVHAGTPPALFTSINLSLEPDWIATAVIEGNWGVLEGGKCDGEIEADNLAVAELMIEVIKEANGVFAVTYQV